MDEPRRSRWGSAVGNRGERSSRCRQHRAGRRARCGRGAAEPRCPRRAGRSAPGFAGAPPCPAALRPGSESAPRRLAAPVPPRPGRGGRRRLQAGFCAPPALLLEIGKFNNQSKGEREEEKSGIRASLMAHARCSLHPKHTHISPDLESHPKQPQVQVSPAAAGPPPPAAPARPAGSAGGHRAAQPGGAHGTGTSFFLGGFFFFWLLLVFVLFFFFNDCILFAGTGQHVSPRRR